MVSCLTANDIRIIINECLISVGIFIDGNSQDDIDLTEFNLDSLSFISFVVDLEEQLNVTLPDSFLQYDVLKSLKGLTSLIVQFMETQS